ncbi:unnamed protein product, partial [Ectocarpus sp. 8 AP-2014]
SKRGKTRARRGELVWIAAQKPGVGAWRKGSLPCFCLLFIQADRCVCVSRTHRHSAGWYRHIPSAYWPGILALAIPASACRSFGRYCCARLIVELSGK